MAIWASRRLVNSSTARHSSRHAGCIDYFKRQDIRTGTDGHRGSLDITDVQRQDVKSQVWSAKTGVSFQCIGDPAISAPNVQYGVLMHHSRLLTVADDAVPMSKKEAESSPMNRRLFGGTKRREFSILLDKLSLLQQIHAQCDTSSAILHLGVEELRRGLR